MAGKLSAYYHSTLGYALIGVGLLWLSLPPVDFWPLAWLAPVWWLMLVRRQELGGRRPYLAIALAGFVFWLAAYYWLTLPHWATSFGWLAVGFYHSFYLPVFIGLSRVAVHGLRWPLMLAAPVVWTGLELVRGHLLTGITMGNLGHTQYRWIELIQISDLVGAYGVSFVVMFAAACIARVVPCEGSRPATWPLIPLVAGMGLVLAYGSLRVGAPKAEAAARVALIQGSIDIQFGGPEDTPKRMMEQYGQLSRRAVREHPEASLLVWPECMFRIPIVVVDADAAAPEDYPKSAAEFRREALEWAEENRDALASVARGLGRAMIIGIDAWHYRADGLRCYNTAVHVSKHGEILGRYDKMHLVIFGEYVPFAKWFPWLQRFTPLPYNCDAGDEPAVFEHQGLLFSPSICYENVIPHVIRRQVNACAAAGREPDVLVNLTNDGWFWGSAELDMHMICGVFRAVECRKPCLIAANTGFSAFIDGDGRIKQRGPRHETDVLVVDVRPDSRHSPYLRYGDVPAGLCLAATLVLAGVGLTAWFRRRRTRRKAIRPAD